MDEKAAAEKQKITTDQDLSRKLKDAEDAARQVATDSATPNNKQPEVVLGGSEDRADDQSSTRGPRTRGGEKWDVSSGKDSPVAETEGEKEKTEEEKDVDLELNTILKRSPSTSHLNIAVLGALQVPNKLMHSSNNLFKILLPILEKSKGHSRRKIHHRTIPFRRGARQTSHGQKAAGFATEEHGPGHCAECTDQREEYWRR